MARADRMKLKRRDLKTYGPFPMDLSPFLYQTWIAIGAPRCFTVKVESFPVPSGDGLGYPKAAHRFLLQVASPGTLIAGGRRGSR